MNKTTALKLITRPPAGRNQGPDHRLFLVPIDGQLWATNSHWAVPAQWFHVVLPERPADGDWAPGTYNAKTMEMLHDDYPGYLAQLFPSSFGDWEELKPVQHGGCDVIRESLEHDLRLYALADGVETGIRRDYVDMMAAGAGKARTDLSFTAAGALKPVAVWRHETITYADRREAAPRMVGLVMPVRIS